MLTSFETLLGVHCNPQAKEGPIFGDLKNNRVFIDAWLEARVEKMLKNNKHCVIRGAEGRGKTVLARIIAYNKFQEKQKVFFTDIRDEEDEESVKNLLKDIAQATKHSGALIIVENCHLSSSKTKKIIDLARKRPNTYFLFTTRKILLEEEEPELLNPFEEWEKEQETLYVDLSPSFDKGCEIVDTFISSENIKYSLSDKDKLWLKKELGEDSLNLRMLNWYLETWKKKGGTISSLRKSHVAKNVLTFYLGNECIGETTEIKEMFRAIAGIFQFDINFYAKESNILKKLVEKSLIISRPKGIDACEYRLQHSTDAACIIDALASEFKESSDALTTHVVKEYLKEGPKNYVQLLRAVRGSEKKHILPEILEDADTYEAIFDMAKKDRVGGVALILGCLMKACDKKEVVGFWSQYKEFLGENLKKKLSGSSLLEIISLLSSLNKMSVDERDLLANAVLGDEILGKKIKDAPFLSHITGLLKVLPKERVPAVINLVTPDVLAQKIKTASLYSVAKLYSVLPNEKVPSSLSQLDLVATADKAKNFSPQNINWFLRVCLQNNFTKNFAKIILSSIKNELVEKLIIKKSLQITTKFLEVVKDIEPESENPLCGKQYAKSAI